MAGARTCHLAITHRVCVVCCEASSVSSCQFQKQPSYPCERLVVFQGKVCLAGWQIPRVVWRGTWVWRASFPRRGLFLGVRVCRFMHWVGKKYYSEHSGTSLMEDKEGKYGNTLQGSSCLFGRGISSLAGGAIAPPVNGDLW